MGKVILPTFFLSHGGGPWPWLRKEMPYFDELDRSLKVIPSQLPEVPRAILVISGHWEENEFTVMSSARPPMIYDYGGFPEHTYHVQYPSPGAPELAVQIQNLLQAEGVPARLDNQRGYDHGTYCVTYPMYPQAEIPVLQLSMRRDYDLEAHLRVGRALAPLRRQGVLILGSGNSYHNLRFPAGAREQSIEFHNWLKDALLNSPAPVRTQKLLEWAKAPSARAVQPREDHLIPLLVAVGAAENDAAKLIYDDLLLGKAESTSFKFG